MTLSGCASTKETVLPQDGPTMGAIYRDHMGQAGHSDPRIPGSAGRGALNLAGYTRDAYNELELVFPRLDNPTLVLYVYPHLTPQGMAIPGYSVALPMYERVHYALPGE